MVEFFDTHTKEDAVGTYPCGAFERDIIEVALRADVAAGFTTDAHRVMDFFLWGGRPCEVPTDVAADIDYKRGNPINFVVCLVVSGTP